MWLIFCIRSTSHTVSVHNGCPEIYTGGHFSTCFRLCRDISLHEALPGGLFKNSQLCNTAKNCPVGELGLWGNCYYFCCKILFPFQDTLVEPCSPWFPPMKLLNSTPWLPRELCCFLEAQSSNSLLPLPPTPTPRQFSGSIQKRTGIRSRKESLLRPAECPALGVVPLLTSMAALRRRWPSQPSPSSSGAAFSGPASGLGA